MRTLHILTAALIGAAPLAAQQSRPADKPATPAVHAHDPDQAVQGGGALPEGWSLRLDRDGANAADIRVAPMGGGLHITMGPSAILWRKADRANGSFRASAGFTRTKAPAHPESYGLFFGGRALDGEGRQYTYLMVRGDGKFLVSRRKGAAVESLTGGWTAHSAVNQADENGKVTDQLQIDASTPGTVRFLVNGQVVHEAPMTAAEANGVVGLRVNHNLDLHVDGLEVSSGS